MIRYCDRSHLCFTACFLAIVRFSVGLNLISSRSLFFRPVRVTVYLPDFCLLCALICENTNHNTFVQKKQTATKPAKLKRRIRRRTHEGETWKKPPQLKEALESGERWRLHSHRHPLLRLACNVDGEKCPRLRFCRSSTWAGCASVQKVALLGEPQPSSSWPWEDHIFISSDILR